jgi:hypothetical protein
MPPQDPTEGAGGGTQPRGRFDALGVPYDGFDPSMAPESALLQYGLPTPNAMASNPLATAFRRRFLEPGADSPLRFVPMLPVSVLAEDFLIARRAAPAGQPTQKSANWSGAYRTPRDGHSFVSVMAEWVVPAVSVPPDRPEQEFHSSTWIGLDGQRFYLDSSLPQIGTKQRCGPALAGQLEYYAWFQWWARGEHSEEQPLALPVNPGDRISAILTVVEQDSVICNLKNVTQNVMLEAFRTWAPSPCRISGATAEWIMERPSPPHSDGWEAYALPVYTPFAFTACIAETQPLGSTALHDRDLEGARLIRMYEIIANPPGTRTVSTARRVLLPEQRLEMSYLAS